MKKRKKEKERKKFTTLPKASGKVKLVKEKKGVVGKKPNDANEGLKVGRLVKTLK